MLSLTPVSGAIAHRLPVPRSDGRVLLVSMGYIESWFSQCME